MAGTMEKGSEKFLLFRFYEGDSKGSGSWKELNCKAG